MKIFIALLLTMFCFYSQAQTPEEILQSKGIVLPEIPLPVANYVNAVRTGNLLFLSGKDLCNKTVNILQANWGKT